MGLKNILLALAHFVVVLAVASPCTGHEGVPSHSPVPTPLPAVSTGAQCSDIIYNMMGCVPYLSRGSSSVEPKSACCSGAKSVLDVNGECICVAIEKSSALGIQLNMTRVQGLPLVCGIGEYPLENCGITGLPGSSPSPSPVEPPNSPGEPTAKSSAEAPEPAPMMDPPYDQAATCVDVAYNIWDCIPYVVDYTLPGEPNPECCPAYKAIVDFDPKCICTSIESSKRLGVGFNLTKFEQLPSYCGVQGYPLDKCDFEEEDPSPDSPTPSPPKPKTPTLSPPKEHVKSGSGPKHSGCRSLSSSSSAAFIVGSIAIVSALFLHSH